MTRGSIPELRSLSHPQRQRGLYTAICSLPRHHPAKRSPARLNPATSSTEPPSMELLVESGPVQLYLPLSAFL